MGYGTTLTGAATPATSTPTIGPRTTSIPTTPRQRNEPYINNYDNPFFSYDPTSLDSLDGDDIDTESNEEESDVIDNPTPIDPSSPSTDPPTAIKLTSTGTPLPPLPTTPALY